MVLLHELQVHYHVGISHRPTYNSAFGMCNLDVQQPTWLVERHSQAEVALSNIADKGRHQVQGRSDIPGAHWQQLQGAGTVSACITYSHQEQDVV